MSDQPWIKYDRDSEEFVVVREEPGGVIKRYDPPVQYSAMVIRGLLAYPHENFTTYEAEKIRRWLDGIVETGQDMQRTL